MTEIESAHSQKNEGNVTSRIIQLNGKRLCIKLEDEYWGVFEDEAQAKHCKFNELVHKYYNDPRADGNKTAFLRKQAIIWLTRNIKLANQRIYVDKTELISILRATIQPAIVFSDDQSVSRYNSVFQDWLVENIGNASVGIDSTKLRINFRRSHASLMENLELQKGCAIGEQAAVLLPGFVFPIRMNVVRLHSGANGSDLFFGIIQLND